MPSSLILAIFQIPSTSWLSYSRFYFLQPLVQDSLGFTLGLRTGQGLRSSGGDSERILVTLGTQRALAGDEMYRARLSLSHIIFQALTFQCVILSLADCQSRRKRFRRHRQITQNSPNAMLNHLNRDNPPYDAFYERPAPGSSGVTSVGATRRFLGT